MKVYKNAETSYIGSLYRERAYRKHIQRMNDIFQGKVLKNKYFEDNSRENKDLILQNRFKARQRSEGARMFKIQRENDVLLDRLVKISTREPHIPDCAMSRIEDSRLDRSHLSSLFENSKLVSLNAVERRLAAKKIEVENVSLSERIKLKQSDLSKKRLEVDYTKHQKMVDRLRKVEIKGDLSNFQMIRRGDLVYGRDGRIVSKSKILPPLPQALYHKKLLGEHRINISLSHRDPRDERVRMGRNASLADISHRHEVDAFETEQNINKNASVNVIENSSNDALKDHGEESGNKQEQGNQEFI